MRFATTSPTSGTCCSCSKSAFCNASKVLKWFARFNAVASPTSRIPNAKIKRARVVCLAFSKLANAFSADFGPIRSKRVSVVKSNLNKSAGVWTNSRSTSCSISLAPTPSMSMALRETKCFSASLRCAAQNNPPVQRATASPSMRTIKESHTGQRVGKTIGRHQ